MEGPTFRKVSPDSSRAPNRRFLQGDTVWFDPGIGFAVPGQVVDFDSQNNTAQVSNDEVNHDLPSSFPPLSTSSVFRVMCQLWSI
jgi:hypothetical protein